MFCLFPLRKYKIEYGQLVKKKHELLSSENDRDYQNDKFLQIDSQINELVEGSYSEAIYYTLAKKHPTLIRVHTGEEIGWEEAFGHSYDSISKSLRHSLVGLVEGGGQYKLKNRSVLWYS